VAPLRSPLEFDEAFEKLRTECWYLHRKENDSWYFSKNENLKKKIEKYAATAAQPKIDAEMERRLKLVFEPKRPQRRTSSRWRSPPQRLSRRRQHPSCRLCPTSRCAWITSAR
jgi:hypothetical protein